MPSVFSNLSSEHKQFTIVIASGIGLLTFAGIGLWLKNYLDLIPPKKWRFVGELNDLICYPIKSCGPIKIKSIECSKIGLQNGFLRDRVFMVVSAKTGEFITGRQYPKMVLIHPEINDKIMHLRAPGMMDIELNIQNLYDLKKPVNVSVWNQIVNAYDCGEDIARWFSRYILCEDFGLRLVFYPGSLPTRDVREKNKVFKTMIPDDSGAFHDATSFMLLNESSLDDLNSKLHDPATKLHFRPNFVVKGPLPYEEDHWKWIKIGNEVVFRNVKPCSRCIFTTVDPKTAEKSSDQNPLKKLKEYRLFKKTGNNPCFGIHLGVRIPGRISLGDLVYVEEF